MEKVIVLSLKVIGNETFIDELVADRNKVLLKETSTLLIKTEHEL